MSNDYTRPTRAEYEAQTEDTFQRLKAMPQQERDALMANVSAIFSDPAQEEAFRAWEANLK